MSRLKSKGLKLITLLMVILIGFSFSAIAKEKVLKVGIENQPKTMDPRYALDAFGMRISHQLLFSTLVQFGQDLQLIPNLAERWETPNPTTYVFHLRRDVYFHDGEKLTASDVKFTFDHLKDPETKSPFAGTYKIVDSIRVIDDYTVEFKLTQQVASFLTSIVMPILPEHIVSKGGDFKTILIGSGPFKYVSQNSNEVILEKNSAYAMGAPDVDKVVFKIVKDDNTRFLKMRKGELDLLINAIPLKKVDDFKKSPLNKKYDVIEDPGLAYNYLSFNVSSKEVQDVRLRQAIAYGIDIQQIIDFRMDGHAVASYSLLSPVNWFSEPDSKQYAYNPAKAKKLLDAAGLRDPDGDGPKERLTLELKTSSNPETVGIARIIQAQLAKIGIKVDLKSYEWGTFFGDVLKGNFQMTTLRWVGVTEPDFYYNLFHSEQFPPTGRNRGRYVNSKIDELTEAGRIELDPVKRKAIYSKIQKILAKELPYISLWHRNNISIVHKRVSGYRQHPMGGFMSFSKIDLTD